MKIAVFGGGVVGGGVVQMLQRYSEIEIANIVVRDIHMKRDFDVPSECIVTSDIYAVLNDDTIDVVVEVMGGTDVAWEVIERSLSRGKHVVTANKALISKYMHEIEKILSSVDRPFFLYEAAVCGGIPIVNAFLRSMRGDKIISMAGVMNGSTNWILDKMHRTGFSYEKLLGEAKELGYLEADPSADIQGWDARSKLCILARLAFGVVLDECEVPCIGIDSVRSADMDFADSHDCCVKLIASAWEQGGEVFAFVMPGMVRRDSQLARLVGPTNACNFEAQFSGSHTFIGSGAGRYPTANSVVSDILEIATLKKMKVSGGFEPFGSVPCRGKYNSDFKKAFYIRAESVGAAETILDTLSRVGISAVRDKEVVETGVCSYTLLRGALGESTYSALLVMG